MLRTFNMGVGLIVVVPAEKFRKAQALLNRAEEKFHVIGRVVKGDRKVQFV
jgi:phosphoribosylformylglycinamidine cyclo-ligase